MQPSGSRIPTNIPPNIPPVRSENTPLGPTRFWGRKRASDYEDATDVTIQADSVELEDRIIHTFLANKLGYPQAQAITFMRNEHTDGITAYCLGGRTLAIPFTDMPADERSIISARIPTNAMRDQASGQRPPGKLPSSRWDQRPSGYIIASEGQGPSVLSQAGPALEEQQVTDLHYSVGLQAHTPYVTQTSDAHLDREFKSYFELAQQISPFQSSYGIKAYGLARAMEAELAPDRQVLTQAAAHQNSKIPKIHQDHGAGHDDKWYAEQAVQRIDHNNPNNAFEIGSIGVPRR
jgi:hypothetical protein